MKAAIAVLDTRVVNLKKMEVSENIKKELAELTVLCNDIKERMNDHKDMQKGVYKGEKDFVSVFKGVLPSCDTSCVCVCVYIVFILTSLISFV